MQWLCVWETSRLNRSYSNRSVWSAHKGRVLAHKAVEAWGTKQGALVSLLSLWPPRGLSLSLTGCQLLHRVEKLFGSGKQQWNYWRSDVFGKVEAVMCWQDETLCASFLSPPLSLHLEICPGQQLPLAVWLKMIGFILWWEFTVGQVLPWDPSQAENPPFLHTL